MEQEEDRDGKEASSCFPSFVEKKKEERQRRDVREMEEAVMDGERQTEEGREEWRFRKR